MTSGADPDGFLSGGYIPQPESVYMDTSDLGVVVRRDPVSGELVWSIQIRNCND